jgi:hypothetical protein
MGTNFYQIEYLLFPLKNMARNRLCVKVLNELKAAVILFTY